MVLHLLPCGLTSPPSRFLSHPQLKISFSETALETTYQYPSESSVLEELGPEPEAPSAPSPPVAQADDVHLWTCFCGKYEFTVVPLRVRASLGQQTPSSQCC